MYSHTLPEGNREGIYFMALRHVNDYVVTCFKRVSHFNVIGMQNLAVSLAAINEFAERTPIGEVLFFFSFLISNFSPFQHFLWHHFLQSHVLQSHVAVTVFSCASLKLSKMMCESVELTNLFLEDPFEV